MTHQIHHFDTIEALTAAANEASGWPSRDSRKTDHDAVTFAGSADFNEAETLLRAGWPEGLKKMKVALDAVSASNTALGPSAAYMLDVAGAYPVAAVAASGDPLCMVAPAPISERARPIIKLVSSVATGAWATAEQIFNYGAGLVAIIDALEAHGFSVDLTSCRAVARDKTRVSILTKVKGAGESLDLERLAFCLGHASYNRRIHFGVLEARADEAFRFSYGTPQLPEHGKEIDPDHVILPPCSSFESSQLVSPVAAFEAITEKVLPLLQDRFATVPPIITRAA